MVWDETIYLNGHLSTEVNDKFFISKIKISIVENPKTNWIKKLFNNKTFIKGNYQNTIKIQVTG